MSAGRVLSTYYRIAGLHTLAASLVWAVNTLFLLGAGLDIFEVFLVNATATATVALFEIPTGVVADVRGRRTSLLLSAGAHLAGTSIYLVGEHVGAPLVIYCAGAFLLGLGATFYSGAVEAWLVDSLERAGHRGALDAVLARGQLVTGATTLVGTVTGGLLATWNLAGPYLLRAVMLVLLLVFAFVRMDEGHTPVRRSATLLGELRRLVQDSAAFGWRQATVRSLLVAGAIHYSFLVWAFHAWQPYLLELLGRNAPWVAGVVSALITLAGMAGNALVERLATAPRRQPALLLAASAVLSLAAVGVGLAPRFSAAGFSVALLSILGIAAAWGVVSPVKQAALHRLVPSETRATILSLDSLLGNAGGVAGQTGLGYGAKVLGIGGGYVVGGLATLLVWPLYGRLELPAPPSDDIDT